VIQIRNLLVLILSCITRLSENGKLEGNAL
jgi:hypothetical protein